MGSLIQQGCDRYVVRDKHAPNPCVLRSFYRPIIVNALRIYIDLFLFCNKESSSRVSQSLDTLFMHLPQDNFREHIDIRISRTWKRDQIISQWHRSFPSYPPSNLITSRVYSKNLSPSRKFVKEISMCFKIFFNVMHSDASTLISRYNNSKEPTD